MADESKAALQKEKQRSLLADYYSRQELSEELGVTTRSLERWAWLRSGPARTKIGGRIYYHRKAVETWLQQQSEVSA